MERELETVVAKCFLKSYSGLYCLHYLFIYYLTYMNLIPVTFLFCGLFCFVLFKDHTRSIKTLRNRKYEKAAHLG